MSQPQRHDDRYAITTNDKSPPGFLKDWKTGTPEEAEKAWSEAIAATTQPGEFVMKFSGPVADSGLKRDGEVIVTCYEYATWTRAETP